MSPSSTLDLHVRAGVERALRALTGSACTVGLGRVRTGVEQRVALGNRLLRVGKCGIDLTVAFGKCQAASRHRLVGLPAAVTCAQQRKRQAQHQNSGKNFFHSTPLDPSMVSMVLYRIRRAWSRNVPKKRKAAHRRSPVRFPYLFYAPRYAARTASLLSSSLPLPVSVMRPVSST